MNKVLGFEYKLPGCPTTTTSKRRPSICSEVLETIKKSKKGINRADRLATLIEKGNKSAEQSIFNALSALKKQNTITSDDGAYKAK